MTDITQINDGDEGIEIRGKLNELINRSNGIATTNETVKLNANAIDSILEAGKNIFNKNNTIKDIITPWDSGISVASVGWWSSPYKRIEPSTDYSKNKGDISFYKEDGAYISGHDFNVFQFTTPSNAYYYRLSSIDANLDAAQIELGSANTDFEPFEKLLPVSKMRDFEESVNDVAFESNLLKATLANKNLFNPDFIVDDYLLVSGVLTPSTGWWTGVYSEISPSTDYSKVGSSVALYDADKVYIETVVPSATQYTTPSNAQFMRVYGTDANLELAQVELGAANTDYESGRQRIRLSQISEIRKSGFVSNQLIGVAKSGGDFNTIPAAISWIQTNYTMQQTVDNPITILLFPGTYYENFYITGGWAISVIGVNKETCICRDDSGEYANAPANIAGPVRLENLTIITTWDNAATMPTEGNYPIHHDFPGEGKSTVENCNLLSYSHAAAIGIGTQDNQQLEIINTQMYSALRITFLFHNYVEAGANQSLLLKDCTIKGDVAEVFRIADVNNFGGYGGSGDNRDTTVTMYNNMIYSTINGKVGITNNDPAVAGYDYGYITLTGDSYGNNLPEFNK